METCIMAVVVCIIVYMFIFFIALYNKLEKVIELLEERPDTNNKTKEAAK